ncbi:hypothetical protein C4K09_3762 [Pseudomonas chlororaphis subsp. aureofaciens]|nr:hypothetical protein C4K09_3762 [Pseudomonas chlororaphis subsp. aureofaciens]
MKKAPQGAFLYLFCLYICSVGMQGKSQANKNARHEPGVLY